MGQLDTAKVAGILVLAALLGLASLRASLGPVSVKLGD